MKIHCKIKTWSPAFGTIILSTKDKEYVLSTVENHIDMLYKKCNK